MTRRDWLHAALVGVALFALYAVTSPRTVGLEDDGLFILSSYFLGIEHPPGYPLFTLVGHLFSQLPFGSVAYRVHLASALFGAAAAAAAWLCARELTGQRLPAYLAAFALGLSPVYWSQSIIAEVYSLNALFFLALVTLMLRPRPPLPWIAFLFGLSLSNHWPLMGLVAPAFVVALWPQREEILRRAGVLAWLVALGLLPYGWLVYRSWMAVPISFYGPLETLPEIWYFVSRAGYAGIDRSLSADWLDRVKFFRFFGVQLITQLAVVGTLLAATGFAVQWRVLGHRVAAFLTIAFLMPSAFLLCLLGFDYSSITKHVFHVYPIPSFAVAALWVALGFAWLVQRYTLRQWQAGAAAAFTLVVFFANGARVNFTTDHEWGARYAQAMLATLPKDAVVFARGEADLGTLAYFHMIENQRPDITLYQTKALVLGNRLFNPMTTDEETRQRIMRETVARQKDPVVFTLESSSSYARVDRWLYNQVDKSSTDASKVRFDVPEEALRFFERDVAAADDSNAWVAFLQGQLRRRYAEVLAQSLPRGGQPDERTRRHLELLGRDFYGALGIAEGLIRNPGGFSVGEVTRYLDRARSLMPSDVVKDELSRFFYVRAVVRANTGDEAGALRDFETALAIWPVEDNAAVGALQRHYRTAGNTKALEALEGRISRPHGPRQ